jgi:hypothetical protein
MFTIIAFMTVLTLIALGLSENQQNDFAQFFSKMAA